jgi:hypothetical protein
MQSNLQGYNRSKPINIAGPSPQLSLNHQKIGGPPKITGISPEFDAAS